jgi:hypothetical protein
MDFPSSEKVIANGPLRQSTQFRVIILVPQANLTANTQTPERGGCANLMLNRLFE